MGSAAAGGEEPMMARAVATISNRSARGPHPVEEGWQRGFGRALAGRQDHRDGQAVTIDDSAQSCEESVRCIESGDFSARRSNIRSHTPALAQRL
jgi:hypothetical protein